MTAADTAASRGLATCHTCCKLVPVSEHECPRCGAAVHLRTSNSLQRTLALLITASILFIPANIYPIMITEVLGKPDISTIIGGVVLLIKLGSIPVALVIFIASVVVPLAKLAAMYYLVWSVSNETDRGHRQRTKLYVAAEFIGKWSMVDVFVVAILVALVQLGGLLVIKPGIAAYSFAGVVLVTMVAAEQFDPRLMWDQLDNNNDGSESRDQKG
jgi:paraquat-inducible protein A